MGMGGVVVFARSLGACSNCGSSTTATAMRVQLLTNMGGVVLVSVRSPLLLAMATKRQQRNGNVNEIDIASGYGRRDASEYGRRDGYVYSFGYSDCSSIPI